jgi:hypothetical protein
MKSAKIFALIVSTIVLLPSASWADQTSINQEINMNSTTTGNGRVTSIETNQQDIQSNESGRYNCKQTRTIYHKSNVRSANAEAIASSRKKFRKQLLDKILREQLIKQRTQIDD